MKKANILSVLLYGVIIFTLSCVPNNAGSASDKSSTKPGSGTTTGSGSGTTTGSGSSTSPLGLKQKPTSMAQAIYDAICKADSLATHIADKNAAIDAIDAAIKLGAVAKRNTDIIAALAGKTHFAGLDTTIIGMLPAIVGGPVLSPKPHTMTQGVYDAIVRFGGANNILLKNTAISAIHTAIGLGAIAQRDTDITNACTGPLNNLAPLIIDLLPVVVASPSRIQGYFDEYLTDFGDKVAPLDIKGNHPGSSYDVLSDARCREFFGENAPNDFAPSVREDSKAMLLEYLAGQILTALSFPTMRVCHYKNDNGDIKSLIRKVKNLKDGINIEFTNNSTAKGGVLVDGVHLQPIMTYFVPALNKWLTAETDYNNRDYLKYIISANSGTVTSFAYDFDNAGKENSSLVDRRVIEMIYNNVSPLTFVDPLMTKEMIFKFIKQMKDFIEQDVGGTSVLSQIVNSPLAERAQNDLDNTFDLNTFKRKIGGQIKQLISKLEALNGLNGPNDWNDFNAREVKRENLAQILENQAITGFDKKLFKLGLLGKYYLDNPSDDTELDNLIANAHVPVTGVINIEKERLASLQIGHSIHSYEIPELTFSYPTNKKYYFIFTASVNEQARNTVINLITSKLNPAEWTLVDTFVTGDINFTTRINSAISENASLIVVGPARDNDRGINEDITSNAILKTITDIYAPLNKLHLPRYVVKIGSASILRTENVNQKPYYKNIANNSITVPVIGNKTFHPENNSTSTPKDYSFSLAGSIGIDRATNTVAGHTTSIYAFLKHMINNGN